MKPTAKGCHTLEYLATKDNPQSLKDDFLRSFEPLKLQIDKYVDKT